MEWRNGGMDEAMKFIQISFYMNCEMDGQEENPRNQIYLSIHD